MRAQCEYPDWGEEAGSSNRAGENAGGEMGERLGSRRIQSSTLGVRRGCADCNGSGYILPPGVQSRWGDSRSRDSRGTGLSSFDLAGDHSRGAAQIAFGRPWHGLQTSPMPPRLQPGGGSRYPSSCSQDQTGEVPGQGGWMGKQLGEGEADGGSGRPASPAKEGARAGLERPPGDWGTGPPCEGDEKREEEEEKRKERRTEEGERQGWPTRGARGDQWVAGASQARWIPSPAGCEENPLISLRRDRVGPSREDAAPGVQEGKVGAEEEGEEGDFVAVQWKQHVIGSFHGGGGRRVRLSTELEGQASGAGVPRSASVPSIGTDEKQPPGRDRIGRQTRVNTSMRRGLLPPAAGQEGKRPCSARVPDNSGIRRPVAGRKCSRSDGHFAPAPEIMREQHDGNPLDGLPETRGRTPREHAADARSRDGSGAQGCLRRDQAALACISAGRSIGAKRHERSDQGEGGLQR